MAPGPLQAIKQAKIGPREPDYTQHISNSLLQRKGSAPDVTVPKRKGACFECPSDFLSVQGLQNSAIAVEKLTSDIQTHCPASAPPSLRPFSTIYSHLPISHHQRAPLFSHPLRDPACSLRNIHLPQRPNISSFQKRKKKVKEANSQMNINGAII